MPSDPTRPGGPRYSTAQRRLLTATAGLVVVALAAGAYVLTYPVLRELALEGRASHRWAPVYPVMADALTAMTILALVVARHARWWTRLLRWLLLLLLVAGAAAAAAQHAVSGFGSLPHTPVRAGVAAAPHVMLVIAVWLWLTMIKQIRVARPAAGDPEPVETQRGHVKLLPALEAPAEPEPDGAPQYAYESDPVRPLDLLPVSAGTIEYDRDPHETVRHDEYEPPRDPRAAHSAREHEPAQEDAYESAQEREETYAAPELDPARGDEYEPAGERADEYEPSPEPVAADGDYEASAREPVAAADDDDETGPEPEAAHGDEYETADDHGYGVGYAEEYGREPSPPLDPLPEPRSAPALPATDVEPVKRGDGAERREDARTVRPDLAMPDADGADGPEGADEADEPEGADEAEEYDGPPADRAEDPDGGEAPAVPRVPRPAPSPEDEAESGEGRIWDWNPPPSGNFRSGPTPPAE